MLVHVLVIVLFGDTSRGGARHGDDLLGALDVTLRRLTPEPGSAFRLAPGTDISSPGSALLPGRDRAANAPTPRPRVEETPAEPAAPEPAPPQRRETQPLQLPESPAAAPIEAVPRLNPNTPEELDRALSPRAVVPPKIEPSPQRIEPVAPPKIERELSAPIEAPARAVPIAPAAVPLERVAPPQIHRELATPAELPPREVPIAPSVPLERVAPSAAERELAPPAELPRREVPLAPEAPPIERNATPTIERELAAPVELAPRPAPAAPGAPLERIAPPRIERQVAPPVDVPTPRQLPPPAVEPQRGSPSPALPAQRAPAAESVRPSPGAAPPAITPEATPARPSLSPPLRQGTPNTDDDIFKPRRDAVTPSEPGVAPRIDLDAAKKRAVRDIAHETSGSRGVLPFPLPVPPEKKSKDANAMEKAIKPDCRTAYAGMGLLAVPALVAAAITDEGCRW